MNDELRSLRKVSFDLLQGGGIPIQQQHTKNIYPSNKCQLDLGWGQVLVRSAPSPFPPRAVYHNNHGGFSFFSLSLLVRFVSFRVFPVRLCVCFLDGLTLKGTYVHSRPFQDSSELCSIFSRSFDCWRKWDFFAAWIKYAVLSTIIVWRNSLLIIVFGRAQS